MGITQHNLHTFLAPKFLFIIFFNTEFAYIVTRLIIIVFFYVGNGNLTDVAQNMSCIGIGVLPNTSFLHIKAWETKHFLSKYAELPVGKLRHEKLFGKSAVARILATVLDIIHPFDEIHLADTKCIAEFERINMAFCLVHDNHNIIRRLVINHQFAISIVNSATRRIIDFLEKSITIGILLEVIAK